MSVCVEGRWEGELAIVALGATGHLSLCLYYFIRCSQGNTMISETIDDQINLETSGLNIVPRSQSDSTEDRMLAGINPEHC